MSLLANITPKFSKAADIAPPAQRMQPVQEKIFDQILAPIRQVLMDDPLYNGYDMCISDQVKELRQICNEVQTRHKTDDFVLKSARNRLLNSLQAILESAKHVNGGFILVDVNDLASLSNFTDIIRGNAEIYREYMGVPLIANVLDRVADNIDAAQENGWKPEECANYLLDTNAANDGVYDQQISA